MARKPAPPATIPPENEAEGPTWDEILLPRLWHWRIELSGVLLLGLGIWTLLGLFGLPSADSLWGQWAYWWRRLAGEGAYLPALALALGGTRLALRRIHLPYRVTPRQLLGAELLWLTALPLTHFVSGANYTAADVGKAGGLLGWALAVPMLDFLGPFLTACLYLSGLALGIGLAIGVKLEHVIRWLVYTSGRFRHWAEKLAADPEAEPVRVVRPPAPARAAAARLTPVDPGGATLPRHNPLLPPLSLLQRGSSHALSPAEVHRRQEIIERTLHDFGLQGKVVEVRQGPVITQFGVEPGYIERVGPDGQPKPYKVRVAQIANLRPDLALALAVSRLRVEAPVPGRGMVGIEVPNGETSLVSLRDVMETDTFQRLQTPLAVALGQDVAGAPAVVDLAKMPHLLMAGTTGSGKSVCMKALIACLVCHNTPDELKLVLIDPKRVEMMRFNGLPHLAGPVEVEGDRIIGVLRWLVAEMERRYEVFEAVNARHLKSFNTKMTRQGQPTLPMIAVFIDELADLMAQYSAEVERTLCRLAQMARATGIHLVVATQRPSTDVLTGLIKANFPARCSFAVASGVDSRVILDTMGAEQLLGQGDMLFLSSDAGAPVRLQSCFVSDEEIDALVAHWQKVLPSNAERQPPPWENLLARLSVIEDTDDLLEQAIALCQKQDNISTSLLQRRLRVGFPRAARLMETLYEMGLVEDPKVGGKTRRTQITSGEDDPLGQYINRSESP